MIGLEVSRDKQHEQRKDDAEEVAGEDEETRLPPPSVHDHLVDGADARLVGTIRWHHSGGRFDWIGNVGPLFGMLEEG